MSDYPPKARRSALGFVVAAAFLAFVGAVVFKHYDAVWTSSPVDSVTTGAVR